MKKSILTRLIASVLFSILWFTSHSQNEITKQQLDSAINKGIEFLYQDQLDDGEFKCYVCHTPALLNCMFDSSPFVTPFILYSIRNVTHKYVQPITVKALKFLLSQQIKGGLWSYWTDKSARALDPDVDDISMISYVLKQNNIPFDNNLQLIENNVNEFGEFLTYVNPAMPINDVDCVVNANVLFYLGKNVEAACNLINESLEKDRNCSIYYPDKQAFYYCVARNIENKITCLDKNTNLLIERTLKLQKADGSFGNDLQTALALCTLQSLKYSGVEIENGIKFLLKQQKANGSWKRECFFEYNYSPDDFVGAESLTTAIAIEVINRYLQHIK